MYNQNGCCTNKVVKTYLLKISNTAWIILEGDGTTNNPLRAVPIISQQPGNVISLLPDGFYASADNINIIDGGNA